MEQIEKDSGLPIRRFEVWYNDENLRLLQKLDKGGSCGGVPFFYNKKTNNMKFDHSIDFLIDFPWWKTYHYFFQNHLDQT